MLKFSFVLLFVFSSVALWAERVTTEVLFHIETPPSSGMQKPYDHLALLVRTHPRQEVREGFPRSMRERKFVVVWDLDPLNGIKGNTFAFNFATVLNSPDYPGETLVFSLSTSILMDPGIPIETKQCLLVHEWKHLKDLIEVGRPYDRPGKFINDTLTQEGARWVFMSELMAYYEEVLFAREIRHIMHDEIHKAFRRDGLLGLQMAVARERITSGHVPRVHTSFLDKLARTLQIKERK